MKYYNKVVEYNGQKFHSKKEFQRYLELGMLEKRGHIKDLKTQVDFTLIPAQYYKGKLIERKISYKADFTYYENEEYIVEDVKGFKTKDYIIKRKLMLFIHNIKILET